MMKQWAVACHFDEIPDLSCKEFAYETEGELVHGFLVRIGSSLRAYKNSCPHLKTNMNWLKNQFLDFRQQHIQCALHGALFEIDTGECVMGPCFGRYLESIPVTVVDDRVSMPMSVKFESILRWDEKLPTES